MDKIASELRKDYSKAIDTIIYSWVIANKKDIINEIFEDIPYNILKKLEKERKKLKKHIMRQNTDVKNVIIESDYDELQFWN